MTSKRELKVPSDEELTGHPMGRWGARVRALSEQGAGQYLARRLADIAERVRDWDPVREHGLRIVLHGAFVAPSKRLEYPSFGVTVYPPESPPRGGDSCVESLVVGVQTRGKSVDDVVEAVSRFEEWLDALSWSSNRITVAKWSCAVLDGELWCIPVGCIEGANVEAVRRDLVNLDDEVRSLVCSAMRWIRLADSLDHRSHLATSIFVFAHYWNALECVIRAVEANHPLPGLSKEEKLKLIQEGAATLASSPSREGLRKLYEAVERPGFEARARHALSSHLGGHSGVFLQQCFDVDPPDRRLYRLRNKVKHGGLRLDVPYQVAAVTDGLFHLRTVLDISITLWCPSWWIGGQSGT